MPKPNYSTYTKTQLIEHIHALEKRKKYGLVWDEERVPEKVVTDCQKFLPVLKEVKEKEISTNQNEPTHILIEGDNYHALSVLNYTHKGKIDLIYIDPPYNTGNNDFIYNDKYVDRTDSYRHSKWLNFMYKRLQLARDLLSENGVIFISIDNNEVAQLNLLCNSVFGEDNFIGFLIWRKKEGGGQTDEFFVTEHEYIIGYRKSKNFKWFDKIENVDEAQFNKQDEKGNFRLVKLEKWGSGARKEDRPTMHFPLISPDGKKYFPIAPDGNAGRWRVGKATMDELIENNLIHWEKRNGAKWIPYEKVYYDGEKQKVIKARSILYEIANTGDGTNELKDIFHQKDIFDNPKPTELLNYIIEHTTSDNATVLDFFAGSGSFCHSIINLNKQKEAKRKCILITNNEVNGFGKKILQNNPDADLNEIGICNRVTYPRIKKVIDGYTTLKQEEVDGTANNLKYYRTAFVPAQPTDKNKELLTKQSIEMLCLRENTFEFVKETEIWKLYRSNQKHTVILFDQTKIPGLKKEISKIKTPVSVYVFSLGDDDFTDDFADIQNIKVCSIPEAILRVYRKIFKK